MTLPFAVPYPQTPVAGYWEPVTSTIDWCEENYVVTPYIAEMMNTISNSIFIVLAAFSMFSARKNKLETRFVLIAFGFGLVGVGSWLFHMTLHYEYQLLDELPMIYATCIPAWSILSEGYSLKRSVSIGLVIVALSQILTVIYLRFREPIIHQVAYAILNVVIIFKAIHLTNNYVHVDKAKRQMIKTVSIGVACFLFAFFLWNMDNIFCGCWISIRRAVGIPYGFFFELHSWWHFFTGVGVYYCLIYLEHLRMFMLQRDDEYQLVEHFGILPELQLIPYKKVSLDTILEEEWEDDKDVQDVSSIEL